jgi:hypothetical protein
MNDNHRENRESFGRGESAEAFFTGRYRGCVRRLDRKQEYAEKIRRKRT